MKKICKKSAGTLLTAAWLWALPVSAFAADSLPQRYSSADTVWVLLGAALVFFMQPGFAMCETGLTRAKNAGNIVMKNVMDFALGTPAFWIVGFGLMFGTDIGGFIGTPDFCVTKFTVGEDTGYPVMAFLIFQTVFCATAATIVSGSMAERTKFSSYCIYSILISLFIYPVSGHWIWGGGWLAQMGFHDFAGSTAVHMVGGVCACIGAYLLGPRIGKYNADGSVNAIPGHSLPLATLGVFILWFAWFGFNGCSTVSLTGDEAILSAAHIFMTTNMAAANGALAGLVSITAGCDLVTVPGAFLIGIVAGIAVVCSIEYIDQKLKIDDPVGAISVHGVCGALGTVLTGLLAEKEGWLYCGDPHFFITQITGVASVILYVAAAAFIVFKTIKSTVGLRVTAKEEIAGLDFEEHGLPSAYADFMPAPEHIFDISATAEKPDPVLIPQREAVSSVPGLYPATPDGHAYSLVCIITSKERFLPLKNALEKIGITGMTVTEVHGYGLQKGHAEMYRGASVVSRLLPKIRLDIVVSAIPPRTIIEVAKQVLYTGKYGDGKIFVSTIDNVIKIRTGEEGFEALQDYPL